MKKESIVQTQPQLSYVDRKKLSNRKLVQAEIDVELVDAVEKELKKRGRKHFREAVQWGLEQFMIAHNSKAASQLGLSTDDD